MEHQFTNDYSEMAHPEIWKALSHLQEEQNKGYGCDIHSAHASSLILNCFGVKDGEVFFLSGGTQTNMTVISYLLRPHEGVIACVSGHINVHETGAVEASGHKVIAVPGNDGKVTAKDVQEVMNRHKDEHMVKPRMVYISDATETGTIYTVAELQALKDACSQYGLYLFMDGARLGTALTSTANDIKPQDIGALCDVFYVGGTKNGMPLGEAVVFTHKDLCRDFRYHIKNRGAMSAKGFAVGALFERAFADSLYFDMARHADEMATYIVKELKDVVTFANDSSTNQQFIKVPADKATIISDTFGCELWEDGEKEKILRIVTSFATTKEDCDKLIAFLKNISDK